MDNNEIEVFEDCENIIKNLTTNGEVLILKDVNDIVYEYDSNMILLGKYNF